MAGLGGVLLALAHPSSTTLALGAGLSGAGHLGRIAAFRWLGGVGRTRDPGPPAARVVGGPYRLRHPVYLANGVVAAGLVLAAGLSPPGALASLVLVAAVYGLLAVREERLLAGLPRVPGEPAPWGRALRWERSSLLTTAVGFALLAARL
jgi:protein-S-isoprenylcysteine O-methyltransferase Ste14